MLVSGKNPTEREDKELQATWTLKTDQVPIRVHIGKFRLDEKASRVSGVQAHVAEGGEAV